MNKKLGFILVGVLVCIAIVCGIIIGLKGNKENANTQDNEQIIEVDGSKSEIDASMDSKNAEYNKIKKTSIVLNSSKNDDGYYIENEILYDASGITVIGVYVKHVTPDYENLETRKSNAEETLKKNGWEYYDVKIVDNHIEMEYVSTTAKTIASNGFIDPLDIEKQVDEASCYKCTVTDNTK